MNKVFKFIRNSKGFTLIELLVVIGILGVLAAALIATIDPFEQIKKAQDANAKNAAVEFVNASIRYYSTHNALMWGVTPSGLTNCVTNNTTLSATNDCIDILIADGELKDGFLTSNVLTNINYIGSAANVTACFKPTSKSQQRDPNTLYNSNAVATSGCPGATYCYWCAK